MKPPYIRLLKRVGNIKVWLVDGKYVRDHIDIDFTEGGHDRVYPFIKPNEVWVDNRNLDEREQIIIHELRERELMKRGDTYHVAHRFANVVEGKFRKEINKGGRC